MAKNETLQPITREEFEAGVKFYHNEGDLSCLWDWYRLKNLEEHMRIIEDNRNCYYCGIERVEDDGFTFRKYSFGFGTAGKVLFKNCLKYPNQ